MVGFELSIGNIWLLVCIVFCDLLRSGTSDADVGGSSTVGASSAAGDVDGDHVSDVYELPWFQHEFKIEIAAGASECFFQHLKKPARLNVAFEVLRGADRNIDVQIRDSQQSIIQDFQWTSDGNFEHNVSVPGVYSFCIDNGLSRFSSKLVYLYLMSYNELDWNKFISGIQDFYGEVDNVSKSLEKFDQHISKVLILQAVGRRHLAADWYTIKTNNSYVQKLSVAMCVVILLTSLFQVYFVRRLFNISPKAKPRA